MKAYLYRNKFKIMFLILLFSFLMNSITIFDFNVNSNADNWKIVDDGVMGGVSTSKFLVMEFLKEPFLWKTMVVFVLYGIIQNLFR
jgi:Complex I intermediate-associated protein 30 (CIA30)